MPSQSTERRLAAILFTDLLGSTSLMAQSEEAGLRAKRRHRELVREQVARFRGDFVEAPGDETLSIFPSALDAVGCGLAIEASTDDEDFELHVAIHLGDVLFEGGEVHGDGVNIAARLLAFSEGGGICISNEVYQAVRNQPDLEVVRLGEHELKNVGRPVEILSLRRAGSAPRAGDGAQRAVTSSEPRLFVPVGVLLAVVVVLVAVLAWWQLGSSDNETPASERSVRSIAVLPLENLSNEPGQEYFTAGMTEALTSNLAKLAAFDVVSRTSVLRYRGAPKPMAQIARELSVDAVLEGSVLRAGEAVRITVQLIDARTDRNLWSRSYERDLTDVLALQREVAEAVASEIRLELAAATGQAPKVVNPAAYEAYLKGRFFLQKISRGSHARAVGYFEQAVLLDPEYAPAWAGLSVGYT
jgi:adenylate cyclase